jgi:hypothetical protein
MGIKVEFGLYRLGTSTSIYNIDFQDVSSYVRAISTSRGKSNGLDSYNAGSAKVVLSNQARTFDPTFTSPYSSLVRPTGVVRISKDDYVIFTGLITDWNLSYEQSGDSVAEIVATDAFWLLANKTLNAFTPADSQTSTARMQTVLTKPEVDWSLVDTDLSVGQAILGGVSAEFNVSQGTSVLDYLQLIERSEVGILFVGKGGKLVFKTRNDNLFALNYSYNRINLSSNPSFINNTTSWNVVSGSITRDTSVYYIGTSSGRLAVSSKVEQSFNAESNATYTMSVYVKVASACVITLSGSQSISGSSWELLTSQNFSVSNTSWNRYSIQMTTDTDYTNAKFAIAVDASSLAYIDAVLIESNPILDVYFDGSNIPTDGVVDGVTYTYSGAWNL